MKRLAMAFVAALVLAGSAAVMARSGDQDFTLINKTGVVIDQLYVSPANADHWGEDVLGVDTLANNAKVLIKFHRDEPECVWDLKIADSDDNSITWQDIDLCKAEEITLLFQNKVPTAIIK